MSDLVAAVRAGAKRHADSLARRRAAGRRASADATFADCTHLLEAIELEPGGLPPKVRIALKSVVKHMAWLERRVRDLERKS